MKKISAIILFFAFAFLACNNTTTNNSLEEKSKSSISSKSDNELLIEKGLEISGYAQGAIGGALNKAMQDGGVPNALSVCNVKALPITDSLAQYHDIVLQRVSDKSRNPVNQASKLDLEVLNEFKLLLEDGEPAMPILKQDDGKKVFYHAILTMTKCMQCHGEVGVDIDENHYEKILSLYPNDLAKGYEPGQVRGAFKITFN